MKRFNIYVTSKPVIYDPAGKAAENALARMNFEGVERLRIGKFIEMECADEVSLADVEAMCDRLLANPVIEDYRIEEQ
ncbi:MAG: phosphoribosylformylglycinamidine synthase subunit PurS [Coriobacteriia bacterium]|nr:phosphoribosylformylglycinamidine synthase subunit PurS [Coriobacteriia bacterium]